MEGGRKSCIFVAVAISCIILQSWVPLTLEMTQKSIQPTSSKNNIVWTGDNQPWSQFGHNPTRNSTSPAHSLTGGFNAETLGIISEPTINWKSSADGSYGVQSYGSAIGDFSNQITSSLASNERCGSGNLFAVFTIERNSNSENDWLVIVEAGLNREAWRVDLGETSDVKSTPAIVDVNGDGVFEIIIAYDTSSGLTIDVWSPLLSCSEAGTWDADQHSNELLWTYTLPDLNLGIAADSFNAGHLATTQALIADLQLDGSPELILSTVDEVSDRPTIVAIPLTNTAPNQPLWEIQLDYGTHPSDPTWAQIDENNAAIFVTTIDSDDGNMWGWRLNSETGSLDWNARNLINEADSGVPHIRLPGPVIAQLDSDSLPEVIFTAPGDWDGEASVDAASFHAWEVTDGSEIWAFTASNGYADAPPLPLDTDDDGIHDFVCWATWFENGVFNSERHGRVGCEDVTGDSSGWWEDIEPFAGNSNDGIALSQPISLDINGIGAPEIILAYGQSLRAFNGDTGDSNIWDEEIDLGKRSWASPALADLDGDGLIDILIGDVLVSQSNIDIAPILDGRGITFSPSIVDPGDVVEITAQYANHGTIETDEAVDAKIYVNNQLISSKKIDNMQPAAPSGDAIDSSFTAQWTASLGTHEIRLELDPNNNLTQSRTDNDNYSVQFTVLEPHDLAISLPPTNTRINPGESKSLDIEIVAVGRRSAEWSMSLNQSGMPENWTVEEVNPGNSQAVEINPEGNPWNPNLIVSIPENAEGSESGSFKIIMTLDSNNDVFEVFNIPIEVNRTRGLSITGPDGNPYSSGNGLLGKNASAWFQIENLGNAQERLTSQTWSSNIWQETPLIFDEVGGPYYSITLEPGEKREFTAKVEVPSDVNLGSKAENTFTACIGSEEDSLCKSIEFSFFANSISITPPHINSIPGVELSWELNTDSNEGDLSIDLASAGMIQPDWVWSAEGHGVLNNNILNISQSSEIEKTWINASIPSQSPPLLHTINSEISDSISINFSINILQVNRAEIEIVEPTFEPVIIDVETTNSLVVKLKNKGNGVDTFKLNAEFSDAGDIKENPGIEFNLLQSTFTLGVDSSVYPTIDYTISENTPAGETISIRISITSTIDSTLSEYSEILITAKQNHNWSVSNISGSEYFGNPNENITITFNVTNTGNLIDTMEWITSKEVIQNQNDSSIWNIELEEEKPVEVNETIEFKIEINVPKSSWEGSELYFNLSLYSDSKAFENLSFKVTTLRNSGWSLKLTNSDLDLKSEGSNITIEIENIGNAIVEPIIIPVLPSNWNITNISSTKEVEPGESIQVTLEIKPPEDLIAGEIGMMTLIVKDGDTLEGRSEMEIPLRIASEYSITVGFEENWIVSSQGGFPLAWVKNTGNALNKISLELETLEGWEVESPMEFYIPSGTTMGVPISIIPPIDWDGTNYSQELTITDSSGESEIIIFNVKSFCCNLDVSWGVSPVFLGHLNDEVLVNLIGEQSNQFDSIQLKESGIFEFEYCEAIEVNNCLNELEYKLIVIQKPDLEVQCEFENANLTNVVISSESINSNIAKCIFSQNVENAKWNLLMRINGELIDSKSGTQFGNRSIEHLTLENWNLKSGINIIEIEVYDGFGILIEKISEDLIIPYENWNIGISSVDLSTDDKEITINMRRENYQQLENAHCILSSSGTSNSGSFKNSWKIDLSQGLLAPTLTIPLPNVSSGESIDFALYCEEPWHIDSNNDDNTYTFMVPPINPSIIESNGWAWGVFSLIIILIIAKIVGILEIKPRNKNQKDKIKNQIDEPKIKFIQQKEEKEEKEEIHFDVDEDSNEEEIKIHDEEINQIVEENSKEIEEIVDVVEIEEEEKDHDEDKDDIDAKINRMMSRKRYYK